MPKREEGFSQPFIILGVVALAAFLLYFSQNSNKQKITQETPKQTQEQTQESTKEAIKDIPNPVNEFLNNNDIEEYKNAGMKIYTGNNPPNIEGLYKSDSLVIFYDKPFEDAAPVGTEVSSYNHEFYDQKPEGTIKLLRKSPQGEDIAAGVGGFISGNNNCFSIFVDVKDQSNQCKTDEATIYSACKTEKGLEQLQAGFIVKENEGSGCGKTVPVGHLRIIAEDDGLAELINKNNGGLNLNGLWEGYDYKFKGTHSGNNLVLVSIEKNKEIVKGSLSGDKFSGTLFLEADGCPNLDKTVSASGTVTKDKISLKYKTATYDTDSCTQNGPETAKNYTAEYTRIED